jgi:hypothetical protein
MAEKQSYTPSTEETRSFVRGQAARALGITAALAGHNVLGGPNLSGKNLNKLTKTLQQSVPSDALGNKFKVQHSGGGAAYDLLSHTALLPKDKTNIPAAFHEAGHGVIRANMPASLRDAHIGVSIAAHNVASLMPTSLSEYASSRVRSSRAFEEQGLVGKIQDKVLSNQGKIMAALHTPRLLEEAGASIIGLALSRKTPYKLGLGGAASLASAFATYGIAAGSDIYNASRGSNAYLKNKEEYLKKKGQQQKSANLRLLTFYADDLAEMGINAYKLRNMRKAKNNDEQGQVSTTGIQYRPSTFLQKKTQDFTGSF